VLEHFLAVHTPLAAVQSIADPLVFPDGLVSLSSLDFGVRLLHPDFVLEHFVQVNFTLASMFGTLQKKFLIIHGNKYKKIWSSNVVALFFIKKVSFCAIKTLNFHSRRT